jgi:hypothetical protein
VEEIEEPKGNQNYRPATGSSTSSTNKGHVLMFIGDLWQVGSFDFLWVLQFPPPTKLMC